MVKKRIGVYSGSFNPIHLGHVRLAEYICSEGLVDEVWLMVSPLNPLKQGQSLESDHHRFQMTRLATIDSKGVMPSDFEFSLPKPNYTYLTLTLLRQTYTDYSFRLIIGADNWAIFDKWRNWQEIIDQFGLLIYPRPGYDIDDDTLPQNVKLLSKAPLADVSSTQIRTALSNDSDTSSMLHPEVKKYIIDNQLYSLPK